MRTVTGLIGRTNRDRYQVATPTATVGIRGTGGLIQILDDGATLVQGTSGIWFLANPAGSINVPAGVSGISPADPGQPPKETGAPPTAGPAPLPPLEEYVQGNQTNPDGTAVIVGSVLVSGSGYMAALAYTTCPVGGGCIEPHLRRPTGIATFDASGQMTQLDASGRASEIYSLLPGGSQVDQKTDGILAWGRWIGPVSVPETLSGNENYGANEGFHYVVGLPTATMPQTGSATYTLIGATSPTAYNSSGIVLSSPGTFSGSLSVADWARAIVTLNLSVNVATLGYAINGDATISGSTFSGSFTNAPGGGITPLPGSCLSACNAAVNGFFAGPSAERAGLAYHIKDDFTADVTGAAAFTKQ
jgi:hypothetical protein